MRIVVKVVVVVVKVVCSSIVLPGYMQPVILALVPTILIRRIFHTLTKNYLLFSY